MYYLTQQQPINSYPPSASSIVSEKHRANIWDQLDVQHNGWWRWGAIGQGKTGQAEQTSLFLTYILVHTSPIYTITLPATCIYTYRRRIFLPPTSRCHYIQQGLAGAIAYLLIHGGGGGGLRSYLRWMTGTEAESSPLAPVYLGSS